MSTPRKYRIVHQSETASSSQADTSPINWDLCALCQTKTSESLECPARSKRKDCGAGFTYVANNIEEFEELNLLPDTINVQKLNDGYGIESTLKDNNARWHKLCRNRIRNQKLETYKRRLDSKGAASPVKTRCKSSYKNTTSASDVCSSCQQVAGSAGLHDALNNHSASKRACLGRSSVGQQ